MTNLMTDDEFAAHWDALIEEAAKAGDEAKVEELMLAYSEAFVERFPL
jgi:hypothetical protein